LLSPGSSGERKGKGRGSGLLHAGFAYGYCLAGHALRIQKVHLADDA